MCFQQSAIRCDACWRQWLCPQVSDAYVGLDQTFWLSTYTTSQDEQPKAAAG